MSEFTATVPGLTMDDDMAWSLVGQSVPLTMAGTSAGVVTVEHAHVTLDGLDLTLQTDGTGIGETILAALHPVPLPVSIVSVTHTLEGTAGVAQPVMVLVSMTYPADAPTTE